MTRRQPRRETPPAAEGALTRLVYSTENGPAAGADTERPRPRRRPEAPAAQPSPRGGSGAVRLRLERRASGRAVTIVTGLPGTPAQVALLARELRAHCGVGGTARDGEVELQGDQRERAAAALVARGLRVKP